MLEISQETIMKAAQGDAESFEQIYRVFSRFVYNVAFRVVGNQQTAEEVTQDVFLAVFNKLKDFQHKAALKTWLYRITVNMAINHAKKNQRGCQKTVEYEDTVATSEEGNEIDQAANKEYHESIIRKLLDSLNPDQRACIVLRNMEGLSYEEIARSLNININTVRTRLKRAREKLLSMRSEVIKDAM